MSRVSLKTNGSEMAMPRRLGAARFRLAVVVVVVVVVVTVVTVFAVASIGSQTLPGSHLG